MLEAARGFVTRNRWWIAGAALSIKLLDWGLFGLLPTGLVRQIPAIGGLLGGLSTLALVVAAVLGFRALSRRFLFRVGRRLGVAFFFVGFIPLLWFAFFVVGVAAIALLHLASHDSHATLQEVIAETALVADRTARVVEGAPSPDAFGAGWQEIAGVAGPRPGLETLVWVGRPGDVGSPLDLAGAEPGRRALPGRFLPASGAPPPWTSVEPFEGVVAFGDSVRIAAIRHGALGDGRVFVALVHEALGDQVAERILSRTGIRAKRLDVEDFVADWRRADVDTLPTTLDGDAADDGAEHDTINVTLSPESATSILTGRVLDWASGDRIRLDEDIVDLVPLYHLEFDPREYVRAHFTDTGQGGLLWLLTKWIGVVNLAMMLIATVIGMVLTLSVARAVDELHRGTRKVAEGRLDHRITVKSKDQLGALATSFNEMTASVKRLLEEKAEKDRLVHEMEIATEVQRTMLPARFPTIPGLEGAATCMMATEVGGDFYDFIEISPERIGIAVGDVSGKGVSAALVMSNVISSLRSMLVTDASLGPAEILTRLNRVLHRSTAPERFVTLFYAEYDLATGGLRYANAGHDWPMVVSPDGQLVLDLESSGLMLGALEDVRLTEQEIRLSPGDVIMAYSDGLVDTVNESGEPFERERAQDAIAAIVSQSPQQVVEALSARLRQWRGSAEEVDDVTLVVLKRVALPGRESEAEAAAVGVAQHA